MGSYEPSSLDSSLHVETMEGEDTGYNLDFSDTMCLFDETHISDSFVLQEFSNTQTADHQPIVEKVGISLTECVLNDDKEDFSKQEFTSGPDSKRVDSVDSYIYHRQPVVDLGRPDDLDVETYVQEKMPVNVIYSTENIKSDSEHFDSLDSCIHQEEPLIGISRPEDLDIETHTQEIMPVSEYVGTAIFSSENVEGDRLCCLENVGTEHEDAVGSLAESVEIPTVSPSLATQPAENNHSDTENAGTQQNNPDDAKNALDLLEKTVGDHLRVNAEKQDLSDKVIQEQHTEETSCILVTQSPNTAFDHPVDVPSSSPVLKISGAVDDSSWRQLATDNQERDLHSSNTTCSNLVDSSRLPVTEERDHIKPDLVHASTCSDVIISPPRRSTRRNKWCHQKSETGKTTASRGKTVNKKLLPGDSLLNAVRRKRSCPCKRARSSIWGSLGNVFRMKEDMETQKDGNHLILVENQKSHKRRVGPGKGRHRKTNAGSSLVAKEKSYTSNEQTSHVRLKVKMGGHDWKRNLNVQAEVLDSSISLPTVDNKCAAKPGNPFNLEIPEFKNGTKNSSEDDLYDNRQFTYADRDLEYSASYPGAHFLDPLPVDKDLESTVTQDTSVGNNFGNFPRGYSQIRTEPMDGAICTQYPDPGTSPDSEVISLSQDVGADAVLTTTQLVTSTDASAFNMELVSLGKQNKSTKVKGNTDPLALDGYLAGEEKSIGQSMKKKPTDTSSLGSNGNYSRNLSNTERHTNGMLELGNLRESLKVETTNKSCELSGQNHAVILSEQLVLNGLLGTGKLMLNTDGQKSGSPVSARNRRNNASEKRRENSRKSANKRKVKKEDSLGLDFHNGESHREIGGGTDISSGTKEQSESWRPDVLSKTGTMELEICNDPGISIENNFASEDLSKSSMLASGFNGQLLPLPNAWVRCDDCYKWRCISTELADAIEATNCRWTCNENLDTAFADCSIPQEKSNAEINAELEITEFSGEEDASYTHPLAKGLEGKQLTVPQQAPWKPIESNIFLHRSRKTQIIDEIMICHCKPPSNGGLGCGDECLNRMLNIECVRGTCPCGDRCSNQQFQKRKYAKLECFRCGKKGHGLQLLESVSEGDFLIEYVGEVLDLNAYEARQREYASRGQKHFYFMTLNGSEVIDACVKGNLGRFINHSCDPNCRTEKWMVNGEVCIGLFAIRNIKKGEEVTFDYNYVRVFGAAAKRCVCGSSECRGYIGGDPLNTDAIVQSDSDEEYPEPVMVDGDGEIEKVLCKITSNSILSGGQKLHHTDPLVIPASSSSKQEGSFIKKEEITRRSGHAVQPLEISPPKDDTANSSLSDVPPLDVSIKTEVVSLSDVPPLDISIKAEVVTNKSPSSIQPLDVSLRKDDTSNHRHFEQLLETSSTITDAMSKSLPDHVTVKGRSKSDIVEDKPTISKANSPAKSSRSIKKGKCRSNPMMSRKPPVVANKPKKLLEGAAHSGPKGVEEKLNELLDTDGSISKRKDAAKAYLKFLYVTASSGDNNSGEGVQSTRDLSIVLDALLKTKRRSVLNDVINKNGLQMLHNIMKQNRRNFNRIPIIRKLLRILELLADKEILTRELINSGPPCAGMESFRESIIQLTRHRDVKVHQTARNFRDKWIPRTFRRNSYSDRDDINAEQQAGLHCNRFPTYKQWGGQGSRPMSGTDSTGQMSGATPLYANNQKDSFGQSFSSYTTTRTITRKRKSRWDQPEVKCGLETLKVTEDEKLMQEVVSTLQQPEITKAVQEQGDEANDEQMSHGYDHNVSQQVETAGSVDAMQDIQDDAPPGFPLQNPLVSCNSFSTATSNLSSDIHQRICSCEVVTGCHQERYLSHLPVSYGVPLVFVDQLGTLQAETVDSWEISPGIPFHPFPPLPPYPREKSKTPLQTLVRMEHGESQRDSLHASHQVDAGIPCTSGTRPSDVANTGPYNQKMAERTTRCSSGNLGRGYFRQQKWNIHPPRIRNRTECGFKGNNSRRGGYSLGVENVENGPENVCRTEDVGRGGEKFNSAPYQSPRHHYDH